jgi:hypothetical protein
LNEFIIGDFAVIVLVISGEEIVQFLLRGIDSMFNEHISEFVNVNVTIVVSVKGLEGFIDVEQWSSADSLSKGFRQSFVGDVLVQDLLDEVSSFRAEKLNILKGLQRNIYQVELAGVKVRWDSVVQDGGIFSLLGSEDLSKFRVSNKLGMNFK